MLPVARWGSASRAWPSRHPHRLPNLCVDLIDDLLFPPIVPRAALGHVVPHVRKWVLEICRLGLALDERRAGAVARAMDGFLCRAPHRDHVFPVHQDAGESIILCHEAEFFKSTMFSASQFVQSGARGYINDRQFVNAGELQGFVAGLERSRTFVPESDYHVGFLLQLMRQSKARRQIEWIGEEGRGRDRAGQSTSAGDYRRSAFI